MNIYDKLSAMKKEPVNNWVEVVEGSYWFERVFTEIGVALELSKLGNGETARELAEKAVDFLYDEFLRNSVVTDDICRKAEEILLPLASDAKKYTMYAVAHAHIDMDWLWGYHETVAITTATFRTMLDLMNEYPDFRFSQSQAATYDITERFDPDLFAEIGERVREGRWEFAGSAWVESDRNLPSAESFSRHILYSKKYLNEKFGIPLETINLDFHPDSFGHTPVMPEILANGGIKYMYHCRGVDGRFIYRWQAPSGAELLVVNEPIWYNDAIRFGYLPLVIRFAAQTGTDGMMKVYGVGDHGGGPTRRDVERLIEMNTWPVAPNVKFSTYAEYFETLEPLKESFPVYQEELGPTFTGCYTSESLLKSANRFCENRLGQAETLSAMDAVFNNSKPYEYSEAWKKALFNQFHDILPGSGLPETKNHALGNFEEVLAFAGTGAAKALRDFAAAIDTSAYDTPVAPLTSRSEGSGAGCLIAEKHHYKLPAPERGHGKTRILHVFNTDTYDRKGVTEVSFYEWTGDPKAMIVEDTNGNKVDFSVVSTNNENGHLCTTILIDADIPALGYTTYIIKEGERTDYQFSEFTPDLRRIYYPRPILENDVIRAEFDENNLTLISLKDKATGREYISKPSAFFALALENDQYIGSSAWVEGIHTSVKNLNAECRAVQTGKAIGKLRSSLTYYIEFNSSRLNVTVSLDKDSSVLRFDVDADWREIMKRGNGCPKLLFVAPFGYHTEDYLYDIQLGLFARPADSLHDSFGRDFIHAPNGGKGMTLFTDTKYGYRGYDDTLQVSILRATSNPDPYPEFGNRRVRIGLGIVDGNYAALHAEAVKISNELPYVTNTSHGGTLPLTSSLVSVDGATISAVKTAEDREGIVVRLHNSEADEKPVSMRFFREIKSVSFVDITENQISAINFAGNTVSFPIGGNAMRSIKVLFAD